MQLASRVAVGLAIFLLAILLPVFLVAWKRKDKGGWMENIKGVGQMIPLM